MERLFEAYVARVFRASLHPKGYALTEQDKTKRLFGGSKDFPLRPDMVARAAGKAPVVLDTKWKRLETKPSQGDMYQMYAYQKRYGAPAAVLVYPRWDALEAGVQRRWGLSPAEGGDAMVLSFAFDLAKPHESAEALAELVAGLGRKAS